jgi:hypothetical protein
MTIATDVSIDKTYMAGIGPVLQGKIPPGDAYWGKLNGSFDNRELTQLDLASELFDGRPVTTVCDPSWRKAENYSLGQHIGLDFDTEDKRSTFKYLLSDPFISRYGSIIYTTPSHTPDKPRARVLFMLDEPIHQAKNYALAATALLWIFGSADRQCKDPVRFFYGCKPGAGEMEWLNHELPLDIVKDLIRRYQDTGRAQHRRSQRPLDRTNQPADKLRIISALNHLDPWSVSYDEWLAVLMALHNEMPGSEGLSLAERWADGKPHEVERKWRGFDPGGNASGQITIGTLFALAKEHGWEGR